MEYPHDLLEIQVLDDSTDETVSLIAEKVKEWRSQGINIVHVHRTDRSGFKAGALANGLESAQGEFIAIFDADFLPHPDFLQRVLPHFDHDRVAFVQARWEHLNRDYSLLTLLQAFSLDTHFAIDQLARANTDYIFNFNGTAGVWRKMRSLIRAAGVPIPSRKTWIFPIALFYAAGLRVTRPRWKSLPNYPSVLLRIAASNIDGRAAVLNVPFVIFQRFGNPIFRLRENFRQLFILQAMPCIYFHCR